MNHLSRRSFLKTAAFAAPAIFGVLGEQAGPTGRVLAGATFGEIRPAATMVVCGLTTPEMKLEIEATARIGAGSD